MASRSGLKFREAIGWVGLDDLEQLHLPDRTAPWLGGIDAAGATMSGRALARKAWGSVDLDEVASGDLAGEADHDHDHEALETTTGGSTSTLDGAPLSLEGTRTVAATGDQGIDGLLKGVCWLDGAISYCDPDSVSDYSTAYPKELVAADGTILISQLSAQQLSAARFAIDADPNGQLTAASGFSVEGLTGLSVTYAGAGSGTGTIAMVNHSPTATASAYYPSTATSGSGGDAFFGGGGDTPVAGNYDWKVILHELGHALGLKHGQDTSVYGAMPSHLDSMEYSAMTYRSYVGKSLDTGYTNESWGYSQTFMMYDIAALQHMYGADYSTNAGDTTYKWTPSSGNTMVNGVTAITPGANRVFLTIWDGGGIDTYNLSAYTTNLSIDLSPGGHSVFSTAQLADLDRYSTDPTHVARGNVFNALLHQSNAASLIENAIGGAGNDTLTGNQVSNQLTGGAGKDILKGGLGSDTLKGGTGADTLEGGLGADRFVFSAASESNATYRDSITDFRSAELDRIVLTAIDANTGLKRDQSFRLDNGDSVFSVGEIRQTLSNGNLLIELNTDKDSTAEMSILILNAGGKLAASDFDL